MRQFASVLAVVVLLLASILTVQAAEYDVYEDGSGDFATIQDAIDGVNDGDTVIVHPGTYYENINFNGKSIILRSEDPENSGVVDATIIDGGAVETVVEFTGAEDSTGLLSGFTITNGNAPQGGGVISGTAGDADDRASISYCAITANSASYGGGLYLFSGAIANCTISNNSADNNGGGLYDCQAALDNCNVINNTSGNDGGGLSLCYGDITNCDISGNSADRYGGGLHKCNGDIAHCTIATNSTLNQGGGFLDCDGTIEFCTIDDNVAGYAAGMRNCDGVIRSCLITNNSSTSSAGGLASCDAEIVDCTITGNTAVDDGGGLADCDGMISGCTVSSNTADDHGGGFVDCDGTISGCTVSNNTAIYDGGAFASCNATITDCTISGNSADRDGGGLAYCYNGSMTFCDVYDNSEGRYGGGLRDFDGDIAYSTVATNSALSQGGGLYKCDETIEFCTITDNFATDYGGGLRTCSGDIKSCLITNNRSGSGGGLSYCFATVVDCDISGNYAAHGGGLYDAYGTLSTCTITDNTCEGDGGGLYGGSAYIQGCTIANNSAEGDGGGLFRCDGYIHDCSVSGNTSDGTGGGFYDCDGTISTCTISNNSAGERGGGLYNCDGIITSCAINNNSAQKNGGGLHACDGTISTCSISNNIAVEYSGGGLYQCHANVSACIITDNSATDSGGGLNNCDGDITNCIISNNSAINGGGLSDCDGNIEDCVLSGNSADVDGGAANGCNGAITNCTMRGNSAGAHGGGLAYCNATISTCTISDNSAQDRAGGAIWCDGYFVNCLITDNSAGTSGGGLYVCNGTISTCTIAGNSAGSSAGGSGIYGCEGTVRDCIIWGNTAPSGAQVHLGSDPSYSCIQDWAGGGACNITGDPLFTSGTHGEYYLSCVAAGQAGDSPCIGVGSDTAVALGADTRTTRTDGVTDSGTVDMGYHYCPDMTAPQSTADSPEFANPPVITITYEASDAGAGLRWIELWAKVDSGDWETTGLISSTESGSFGFWIEGSTGTHCFQTVATDIAGNVEAGPSGEGDSCTTIESIPPVSSCTSPEYSNSTSITVAYMASDTGGSGLASVALWYKFGGSGDWVNTGLSDDLHGVKSGIAAVDFEFTASDGEGTYYFQTVAEDQAGNVEAGPSGDGDDSTILDVTAPTSDCDSPELTNSTTIPVTYEASDTGGSGLLKAKLWYRYGEDETWYFAGFHDAAESGTYDFAASNGDGVYYFQIVAEDAAGNYEPNASGDGHTATLLDTTAPMSACTSPQYTTTYGTAVTFEASDENGSGILYVTLWYKFGEDGVWTSSGKTSGATSGELDFSAVSGNGTYYLQTIAGDVAGNTEATPSGDGDTSTIYDSLSPESSCQSPEYANSSPIAITFEASDVVSGIASVELCYRQSGDWIQSGLTESGTSGSFNFVPHLGYGTYEFCTIAADNASNIESAGSADDTTVYDGTAPESSCTSPDYANTTPIVVSFTASDELAGVTETALWFNHNGAGWTDSGLTKTGASGSFNFVPQGGDGTYEFTTVATHNAGNAETPTSADDSTIYDTTAPSSSCTSPPISNSSPITVDFTVAYAGAVVTSTGLWYKYENQGWANSGLSEGGGSGSFSFAPSQGQGTYEFYTSSTDAAGNVEVAPGEADDSTIYDSVAPTSSCDSDSLTSSTSISISYDASDFTSGLNSISLWGKYEQGGTWIDTGQTSNDASGQFTFTASYGDGVYYFATVAEDNAGNTESNPAGEGDSSTLLDTTAPWSSADSPANVSDLPIAVTFAAGDSGSGYSETQLYYQYESGDWLAYGSAQTTPSGTISFSAPSGAGTYNFYTRGTDTAGNVEAAPASPDATTVYRPLGQPSIGINPANLEFGEILVGESETLTVEVSNRGDEALELTVPPIVICPNADVDVSISSRSAYYAADSWASIPPDGSIVLRVILTPTAAGDIEETLTIYSNDPNNPASEVGLTAVGYLPGGVEMSIASDSGSYTFGDDAVITVGMENNGATVQADIYVALAYDVGGAGERYWSPVGFDAWTEGIVPWLPNYELPSGLDTSDPVWSLPVPYDVPNLAMTGDYTLFVAATEPGTLNFISDITTSAFSVEGSPFLTLDADAASYGLGDTLNIGVGVSAPGYDVSGDIYLIAIDADGQFWSPNGATFAWTSGLAAFMPAFTLPAGLELTLDGLWQIPLTGETPPFTSYGDYLLMAGITETGGLTLWCDIATDAFVIE